MALQRTGQIGLGDINVELGRARTAQISLDTAENGGYFPINVNSRFRPNATNPAAISEWYGYNHERLVVVNPTVPFVWQYTNESASTFPFEIFVNGTLTVSTPITSAAFFEVPINAFVRFRVRENRFRPDWQSVIIYNSFGQQDIGEVIADEFVDITMIAQEGETYTVEAGNTNFPPEVII